MTTPRCTFAWRATHVCRAVFSRECARRSRAVAELVIPADRVTLCALLEEARRAFAESRRCESFAPVRHSCATGWQPVELKACTDGEHMYCVLLDARIPTRLESPLPQFLLSTSARCDCRQRLLLRLLQLASRARLAANASLACVVACACCALVVLA